MPPLYIYKTTLDSCSFMAALAARSCEEANNVEACTITAPDAITAFAVPNPKHSSQSCRFFRVRRPGRLATGLITQSISDWLILFEPTLSIVDNADTRSLGVHCQCRFSVHRVNKAHLLLTRRNQLILRVCCGSSCQQLSFAHAFHIRRWRGILLLRR